MRTVSFTILLTVSTMALFGQAQSAPVTLTPQELSVYAFVFKSIADPVTNSSDLTRRQAAVIREFGMNAAEAGVLGTIARQCYAASLDTQQRVNQITAGKAALSAGDLAELAQLDYAQKQRVSAWATALLQQLRPEVAARFKHLAEVR